MKKKSLALLAALVLVAVGMVGGTLAWLTAESKPVVNIFTTSDINITLTETPEDYKMVPGWTIHKDPKVTVTEGSEDCYLFVKLEKSTDFDSYLDFTVADGWEQGDGTNIPADVYYRVVNSINTDQSFEVLEENKVTVSEKVTKEMMETAKNNNPTLIITAYASQLYKSNTDKFSAVDAWNNAQPTQNP